MNESSNIGYHTELFHKALLSNNATIAIFHYYSEYITMMEISPDPKTYILPSIKKVNNKSISYFLKSR